jgi:hypothetical protein
MTETYGPPCPFRAIGYTWKAGLYPLSPAGIEIIAEHNNVRADQLPRGARNSSGPQMHSWIEALAAAKLAGRDVRKGDRWLLPSELAVLA